MVLSLLVRFEFLLICQKETSTHAHTRTHTHAHTRTHTKSVFKKQFYIYLVDNIWYFSLFLLRLNHFKTKQSTCTPARTHARTFSHAHTNTHTRILFIISKVKLPIVVEGDQKAPFSIATTLRCRGGRYSFPSIAPLHLDTYLILLSVKQGGIKYHF